jgi:hypothetical protein
MIELIPFEKVIQKSLKWDFTAYNLTCYLHHENASGKYTQMKRTN